MERFWKNSSFDRYHSFYFNYEEMENAILSSVDRQNLIIDCYEVPNDNNHARTKTSRIFRRDYFIKAIKSAFPDLYKKYKLLLME